MRVIREWLAEPRLRAEVTTLLFVLATVVGSQALVGIIEEASWGGGSRRAQASLALVALTTAIVMAARCRHVASAERPGRIRAVTWLLLACLAAPTLVFQVQLLSTRMRFPVLNDIPVTTMAAARAMAAGQNPYRAAVDPRNESKAQGRNFDGLKYTPLMAVWYAPAALARSDRAVVLTNACLHIVAALLIALIALELSNGTGAALAALFYVSLPIVPRQIFGPGVTDLAAVVPLLAAFLVGRGRPLASGLLVGVSMSAKIFPGAALVLILAPPVPPWRGGEGRRFWVGLGLGALPALVYFLWSPADFFTNVLLFSLARPVDSTSWLEGHPAWWRQAATVLLGVVVLLLSAVRWAWRIDARGRAVLALAATVALTLLGPANHGNYQLWWIPWQAIVLGVTLATPDIVKGRLALEGPC